jgi:NADH-quinone oxidoreductase subunit D
MINRIGGLEHAIAETGLTGVEELAHSTLAHIDSWLTYLESRTDLHGLAVLSAGAARDFACSGPVGQGSGLDWDLRRDDPYLHYDQISTDWSAPVDQAGDAAARYRALVKGMLISAAIIDRSVQELRDLQDEPVAVQLPKTLRAPESTVHVWTQNPLGVAGWLLVSGGENMPVRLKARTPSFAHLQAMPLALPGTPTDLLGTAVASFFFVSGDADR